MGLVDVGHPCIGSLMDRFSTADIAIRLASRSGPEIFGGLGGIDTLVPGLPSLMPMYRGITRALKQEGYQERRDLFGAPYDFRLAADGLEQVTVAFTLACGQCQAVVGVETARLSNRHCSMLSVRPACCTAELLSCRKCSRVLQALLFQEQPGRGHGKLTRPQLSHLPQLSSLRLLCADRVLCGSQAAH